jgi:oligosaccharide repeat unit polymerase
MGYILVLIAIFLYFRGKKVYSIALFFSFILSGFRILPDIFLDAKLTYMAFIYVCVISLYNAHTISGYFTKKPLSKPIGLFLMFILVSCCFSCFYYGFSSIDVIVISFRYSILLSYFFLIRLSRNEVTKVLHIFLVITTITAVLFILQTFTAVQLLAYSYETWDVREAGVGIVRWQNRAPLVELFLLMSIFCTSIFNKKCLLWCMAIFVIAMIVGMVRTSMISMLGTIIIGFILVKKYRQKFYKRILLLGIILLPLFSIINSRFETGGTRDDLKTSISLNNVNDYIKQYDGSQAFGSTLTFRIAWIMERWQYLQHRPFVESLFGLGLMPPHHPEILRKYDFKIGLIDQNTGRVGQIRTIDTAWGNLLTTLGILGTCLWLYLCYTIVNILNYRKKIDELAVSFFLLFIYYLLFSIAHSEISEPYTMVIFFLSMGFSTSDRDKIYK